MADSSLLTAVIPVSSMAGRLSRFDDMVQQCDTFGVDLIVVHDFRDAQTGIELKNIIGSNISTNIKYLEGKFGSAGLARNAGLKMCESKWVCFWDSDDEVLVDRYLDMVTSAENRNCHVAIGLISVASEAKTGVTILSEKLLMNNSLDLQLANFPAFTRMGFRTKNLTKDPFPDIPIGEDLIFLMKQKIINKKLFLYEQNVYRYYVGNTFQSSKLLSKNENFGKLLNLMLTYLKSAGPFEKRYVLASINKIFLGILRSVLKRKQKMISWKLTKWVLIENSRTPFRCIRIFLYFITHRSAVIRAIHG